VTKHANVEVSGQTVKNMFDQTQMNQLIQAAEQARYTCPLQTSLIRGCPNEQNIAHQTQEQKNCSKFLIECLMAFKFYQTRPHTIKQHQTRWPNVKMFGHQTMFDGVWRQTFPVCPGPNSLKMTKGHSSMIVIKGLDGKLEVSIG